MEENEMCELFPKLSIQGGVLRANKDLYPDIGTILAQVISFGKDVKEWHDRDDHWEIKVEE